MTESQIVEKLNRLAGLRTERSTSVATMQARVDELERKMATVAKPFDSKIKKLEDEIKDAVIEHGATVRGEDGDPALMAVYMSARVTWNTDFLEGLMQEIPAIKKARTVGEPSAQIRKIT